MQIHAPQIDLNIHHSGTAYLQLIRGSMQKTIGGSVLALEHAKPCWFLYVRGAIDGNRTSVQPVAKALFVTFRNKKLSICFLKPSRARVLRMQI
jgi:hypothetical protein